MVAACHLGGAGSPGGSLAAGTDHLGTGPDMSALEGDQKHKYGLSMASRGLACAAGLAEARAWRGADFQHCALTIDTFRNITRKALRLRRSTHSCWRGLMQRETATVCNGRGTELHARQLWQSLRRWVRQKAIVLVWTTVSKPTLWIVSGEMMQKPVTSARVESLRGRQCVG